MRPFIGLFGMVCFGLKFISSADAATVFVDWTATNGSNTGTNWTNAYTSLQSALNQSGYTNGDQIWVADGTYKPGTTDAATFILPSQVAVLGGFAGGETQESQRNPAVNETILSGDINGNDQPNFVNYGDNSKTVVTTFNVLPPTAGSSRANLDGFTIRGAKDSGIQVWSTAPVFRKCLIKENQTVLEGGGVYIATGGATFRSCRIVNNRSTSISATSGGGGIKCERLVNVKILDTEFSSNQAPWGGAIIGAHVTNTLISNCKFTNNSATSDGKPR